MKKTLLTLCAALLAVTASALVPVGKGLRPNTDSRFKTAGIEKKMDFRKAPATRGDQLSIFYTLAYGLNDFLTFGQAIPAGSEAAYAMEITEDNVKKLAGNNITSITFITGGDPKTGVNSVKEATVFLSYDLEGEPFCKKTVALTPDDGLKEITVELDKPYTIQADKPVFVGVSFIIANPSDLTIPVDVVYHGADDAGGWIGIKPKGQAAMEWDNYSSQFGFVVIGAGIEGDKLPTDEMEVSSMSALPVVYENQKFDLTVTVTNLAANPVSSVELSYKLGNDATEGFRTHTVDLVDDKGKPFTLGYNQSVDLILGDMTYPVASKDKIDIIVVVSKIDGRPNKLAENGGMINMLVAPKGKSYFRNAMIEEFTGTWCGWCPRGIVAMEYIRDNFKDNSIIPIAIHGSNGNVKDPMESSSFSQVLDDYAVGFPGAIVNRYWDVSDYLNPYQNLVSFCQLVNSLPAITTINATASVDKDKRTLTVDTKTAFSFDYEKAGDRFRLAYAITEDNVGPYEQNNYFSGLTSQDLGGEPIPGEWNRYPQTVEMEYNDVARQLDRYIGVKGSVPDVIEAGKEYDYSRTITLLDNIKNLDNINVVVYVLNREDGSIENSTMVRAGKIGGQAAVEGVEMDETDAPVEYFNLQGVRVSNPSNGLYIRRQGSKTEKVIIK